MIDIKYILSELSDSVGIGNITEATDVAEKYLSQFGTVKNHGKLGRSITLKGENDYTLLIDAHIDEVGFVVTNISPDGFVTVKNCGGIDLRHLAAKPVTIHGKKNITGIFVSTPPHLSKESKVPEDISEIKIDTGMRENADKYISIGNFVTFKQKSFFLNDATICGKSLDNRAGVAALIAIANKLSGEKLPINVKLLLSDAEELGLRGARTAVFGKDIDEAVVIDVSFGDSPDIPSDKCGKLGCGAMVGISAFLDGEITRRLKEIPQDKKIPYQFEGIGENTSTNADVISVNECGIPTGLLSIPLRNMHTDTEIVKTCDVLAVADILAEYVLTGGIMNV